MKLRHSGQTAAMAPGFRPLADPPPGIATRRRAVKRLANA